MYLIMSLLQSKKDGNDRETIQSSIVGSLISKLLAGFQFNHCINKHGKNGPDPDQIV